MHYLGFVIEQLGRESEEAAKVRRHHRRRQADQVGRRSRRTVRRGPSES